MGLLDNFEKGLERAVNGAFAKTFRSGLQPVEITAALKREIDTKAAVVSRDRVLVPNKLHGAPRAGRLRAHDGPRPGAHRRAHRPRAEARGEPALPVRRRHLDRASSATPSLSEGMVQVDSLNVKGQVAWTPVLDIDGKRYPIIKGRTVIGRGSEADITLDDSGTSRRHVEVQWDGTRARCATSAPPTAPS